MYNIWLAINTDILQIKDDIAILERYMATKLAEKDFHAVWDVAIDLKCLEDKLKLLEKYITAARIEQ